MKKDILRDAINFAVMVHDGAKRKLDNAPYILHPMEACVIASTMTDDVNVLAAAILHDTIEDAGVSEEEIRERFGSRVAELVLSETEDKMRSIPGSESWKQRKKASLEALAKTEDEDVKIIWLADKLSNLRSMVRLLKRRGNELWSSFNQRDPAQQAWFYLSVARSVASLERFEAYTEFKELIGVVFKGYDNEKN